MGAGALIPGLPSIPTLPDLLGIPGDQLKQTIERARIGITIILGVIVFSKLYSIVFPRPDPMEKIIEFQMQQMQMDQMMRQDPYKNY